MPLTSGESSGRQGRERGRRGAEFREREGEREELSVKNGERPKKKKKEKGNLVVCNLAKTASFCSFKTTSFG